VIDFVKLEILAHRFIDIVRNLEEREIFDETKPKFEKMSVRNLRPTSPNKYLPGPSSRTIGIIVPCRSASE